MMRARGVCAEHSEGAVLLESVLAGHLRSADKKMCKPDDERMKTEKDTRAEPHCSFDMLDREVGLAGPYLDLRAD